MNEYKAVRSSKAISQSIVEVLEQTDPQTYTYRNRARTILEINDSLQDRAGEPLEDLFAEWREKYGNLDGLDVAERECQAFQAQKKLLAVPYRDSDKKPCRTLRKPISAKSPLKIIDQQLYDQAAKDGFPPEFFRTSYFNHVTLYCLPENTDLNFSEFHGCTFAVCRIRYASFGCAKFYDSEFHSCDLHNVAFMYSSFAHTQFNDSLLDGISFRNASMYFCDTLDCTMRNVSFLDAALDNCRYGRINSAEIRDLHSADITRSGATGEDCKMNRDAVFLELGVPDGLEPEPPMPPKHKRRIEQER